MSLKIKNYDRPVIIVLAIAAGCWLYVIIHSLYNIWKLI